MRILRENVITAVVIGFLSHSLFARSASEGDSALAKTRKHLDGVAFQVGSDRNGLILHSEVREIASSSSHASLPAEYLYPATQGSSRSDQALQFLINKYLIEVACHERGLGIEEGDVDKQLNKIVKSREELKSVADLEEALLGTGRTLASFKADLESQLLFSNFQKLVGVYVKITRADLQAYYYLKTGERAESVKVKAKKIKIPCTGVSSSSVPQKTACRETAKEAQAIYKELVGGLGFDKALQLYSKASASGEADEYDLNTLGSDELREEFSSLSKGDYTKPILVGSAYYIFAVLDRHVSLASGFNEMALKEEYHAKRMSEEILNQITKLRSGLDQPSSVPESLPPVRVPSAG